MLQAVDRAGPRRRRHHRRASARHSSTGIQGALIPAWAQEGGRKQTLTCSGDAGTRAKVKAEIVRIIQNERGAGDPNIVIAACDWDASLAGKNLSEIAGAGLADQGLAVDEEPTVDHAADAALWIVGAAAAAVFHAIGEEDLNGSFATRQR